MKAAAFRYTKPATLDEAVTLLTDHGDDARILAGGQTLLATLNMRLSEPKLLVDITGLDLFRGIELEGDSLLIGALTTHADIERSAMIAHHAPLLHSAAPYVAHRAIRNRGTFGGSIACADPAAEWPACLLALGGTVLAWGPQGEIRIPADSFFRGLYSTALPPGHLITGCEIPAAGPDHWFAFSELARRHGDYAIVGVAMTGRRCTGGLSDPRIVLMGVGATPVRATQAEVTLRDRDLTETAIAEVVCALRSEIEPVGDLTNSPATKRHLAGVLVARLLGEARVQPICGE